MDSKVKLTLSGGNRNSGTALLLEIALKMFLDFQFNSGSFMHLRKNIFYSSIKGLNILKIISRCFCDEFRLLFNTYYLFLYEITSSLSLDTWRYMKISLML